MIAHIILQDIMKMIQIQELLINAMKIVLHVKELLQI